MSEQKSPATLVGIVVGVIALAALGLFLAPRMFREPPPRPGKCGANLNAIGKAFAMYAADNNDSFPWIQPCDNAPAAAIPGGTDNVYEVMDASYDNILENLNVLMAKGQLSNYEIFLCPQAPSGRSASPRVHDGTNKKYGLFVFPEANPKAAPAWEIDYGLHLGYPTLRSGQENPARFSELKGGFPIIADADVGHTMRIDKGWNHGVEGVNILDSSSSVKWTKPAFDGGSPRSGWITRDGDNIYSAGGLAAAPQAAFGVSGGEPAHEKDSSLYSPPP